MLAPPDRSRNGKRHDRGRNLVEALGDAAQAEPTQTGSEPIGKVPITQETEAQRGVSSVEQLEGARRLHGVHLVETELIVEDVERPICLSAGPRAQMRRTVDEDARAVDRIADAAVPVEVCLGHGANTTR